MKIGLIQQSNTKDRALNISKLEQNIRLSAAQGAGLIVMQELHNGCIFARQKTRMHSNRLKPFRVLPLNTLESWHRN